MSFREALDSGKFVVTAEVGPPKGADIEEMIHHIDLLRDKVDAINFTDNQSAVMRMNSLSGCKIALERGAEPILQMTCRDRNRIGLQSDLLGAYALGVKNVLCMTGDHVSAGDHKGARPVYDLESVQLLKVVDALNNGKDMEGNDLKGSTGFFQGAVVTPEANPLEPQLIKFEKKVYIGYDKGTTRDIERTVISKDTNYVYATQKHIDKTKIYLKIVMSKEDLSTVSVYKEREGKEEYFLKRLSDTLYYYRYKGKEHYLKTKAPIYDRHTLIELFRFYNFTHPEKTTFPLFEVSYGKIVKAYVFLESRDTIKTMRKKFLCYKLVFKLKNAFLNTVVKILSKGRRFEFYYNVVGTHPLVYWTDHKDGYMKLKSYNKEE